MYDREHLQLLERVREPLAAYLWSRGAELQEDVRDDIGLALQRRADAYLFTVILVPDFAADVDLDNADENLRVDATCRQSGRSNRSPSVELKYVLDRLGPVIAQSVVPWYFSPQRKVRRFTHEFWKKPRMSEWLDATMEATIAVPLDALIPDSLDGLVRELVNNLYLVMPVTTIEYEFDKS